MGDENKIEKLPVKEMSYEQAVKAVHDGLQLVAEGVVMFPDTAREVLGWVGGLVVYQANRALAEEAEGK